MRLPQLDGSLVRSRAGACSQECRFCPCTAPKFLLDSTDVDHYAREAAQQVCEAAGARLVVWFGRTANGPGAMVIFETNDPTVAPAIVSVAVSSGILQNVRLDRLLTQDEIINIRESAQKIAGVYKAPGQ